MPRIIVELESVTCASTEDIGFFGSEDEFYVTGSVVAGSGAAKPFITAPLDIDNGQELPLSRVIFDESLPDDAVLHIALRAYDEDAGKEWQKRREIIDRLQEEVNRRLEEKRRRTGEQPDQPDIGQWLVQTIGDIFQSIAEMDEDDLLGTLAIDKPVVELPPRFPDGYRMKFAWTIQQGTALYWVRYMMDSDRPPTEADWQARRRRR